MATCAEFSVAFTRVATAFCLTHLAGNWMVSASTRNQALSVIHPICREVLRRDPVRFGEVARTKRPRRLPTAFACDEAQGVRAQLDETCGLTVRLLYGSGRRLMECLPLRREEVDFTRRTLFVRRGTGCQDWTPILARWQFAPR
jgi:integrase